ncbi:hypothetical protein QMK19_38785 [Streptomyces sp. H10-C2]|uniref:hypothetical protein n=1 Tax=unclassified Streptomyces TaxID=2593676 RepID=UPI0024B9F1B8|nr:MULTISPECIES: hypothetical protein [unclassified Streptomyces]MDJ0347137.1 hypothetical protein [Streptomyces sp. PH10-H1]MDJ0375383.1 hypothetical protein [Streptomyces sp. H10-C2]
MSAQDVVALLVAVLVPMVTAAAGVVSLLLQDRRIRRSRAGRRQLAFEDATRQVAFAAEWWTARQLLPSTPETLHEATAVAQGWLDEASELVNAAERARTDDEPHVSVSRLLLLYRFRHRSAKVIRVCFYGTVVAMAYGSMGLLSEVWRVRPGMPWCGRR